MRCIPIFAAIVIGASCSTVSHAREPLPLEIKIDLDDVALIEEIAEARQQTEERLEKILREHIAEKLETFWTTTQQGAEHHLTLEIAVDSDDYPPEFTFELHGKEEMTVHATGHAPVSSPSNLTAFQKGMERALKKVLRERRSDLNKVSEHVHSAWDFGVATHIAVTRPLSSAEAKTYKDSETWIIWPHSSHRDDPDSLPPEPFRSSIHLAPNVARVAHIRPMLHHPIKAPVDVFAKLCITREMAQTPGSTQPVVNFQCPLLGVCTLTQSVPAGWANSMCEEEAGMRPGLWNSIVGAAHANIQQEDRWSVPSINTLYKRLKSTNSNMVGFTEFEIDAEEFYGLDADAFTFSLLANGVPIRFDGVPPEENVRFFDPEDGLYLRFGLENLQFSGRDNGCEEITATIQFMRQGAPVGDPLVLKRSYVALRNAHPFTYDTPYGKVRWTGDYRGLPERRESGIFLASGEFKRSNEDQRLKTLSALNNQRNALDEYGWTIGADKLGGSIGLDSVIVGSEELPIVGIIRPPRTEKDNGNVSYGLLVGIQEPGGQLLFTFDQAQTEALTGHLRYLSTHEGDDHKLIPRPGKKFYTFTYTKERQTGPDWVCQ